MVTLTCKPYNLSLPKTSPLSPAGRILALDVGKKRIGLAISDELGFTAQGLETLHRSRIREDLARLSRLAREKNVGTILVGKPLHMSGSASRQSVYTEEFAERLREWIGLPIVFWDERLTTVEAERVLREAGATLEESKGAVDRMSAVLLLESYLENQRIRAESDADPDSTRHDSTQHIEEDEGPTRD
jgi:putative holliday junction resolvase